MASEVIQVEDILAKNSQSKSKKNDSMLQYAHTKNQFILKRLLSNLSSLGD